MSILGISFINSWTGVRVKGEEVEVSQLFKWYAQDFSKEGLLGKYLAKYHSKHSKRLAARKSFRFFPYDWSLNKK